MTTNDRQHKTSILQSIEALLWCVAEIKKFHAILAVFLDASLRTTLDNVKIISASTASRFFSHDMLDERLCWEELNHWQFEQLYRRSFGRGRKPEVVLKLDLTCIEKTGKKLPFTWCYNKRYGIQLLTLHACFGSLSFPIATSLYEGKHRLAELALELLEHFPIHSWPAGVIVMADAAFGTSEFLQGTHELGFEKVLVRCDRRLTDGRKLSELARKGESDCTTCPKDSSMPAGAM